MTSFHKSISEHSVDLSTYMETDTLRIGLIGDIQYCDREDGQNYSKTCIRRYRQSLETLQKASRVFIERGTIFNIILGDVVDGKAKKDGNQVDALSRFALCTPLSICLILQLDSLESFSGRMLGSSKNGYFGTVIPLFSWKP